MNYQEVLANAKKIISAQCRVCPECNGVACKGKVPGPGGKGTGRTFMRNYEYINEHVYINMDVIGEDKEKDTTISLFGKEFAAPIFCAPIGAIGLSYSDAMTDYEYSMAVVKGTKDAGCATFGGGGAKGEYFISPLQAIRENDGWGIPTLKPWEMPLVREQIETMKESNPFAFSMDVDSAGLPHAANSISRMASKTQEDIREIVELCDLPFVVKGIMTPQKAVAMADAGAYGIVVSNHGGRVMDYGLSTAEVLPEIREAVGDRIKIFVDGGVRTGGDVFKMLALGADAVLIGRPYAVAAFGGGAEGVKLYTEKVMAELKDVMKMTNCVTLADITRDKIRVID